MKKEKITAAVFAAVLCLGMLSACSSEADDAAAVTKVVEATDADDSITVAVDDDAEAELEITDKDGNVLTVIPIYNSDGVSIIAGYIEKAEDKSGNELDEKSYSYLKTVAALVKDEEGNYSISYSDDKPVTLDAICDESGYIIALQDSIDIDGDKDKTEYFQVVTKADSDGNLFIKLDKDDSGNLINVTVKKDGDGNAAVTTSDGKTISGTASVNSVKLGASASGAKTYVSSDTGSNTAGSTSYARSSTDYVAIVLQNNGKVSCDADNVTVNEASALNGGTEVIVEGAGQYSKYYVTSETSIFSGQLEFRFSVDENVEVKFYNVSISTSKKTAVKFTNVDSEQEKENDTEETGSGTDQSGSSVATPVPKVECSFTGVNSFKATGSGKNGTVYSECKLAVKGHGSAEIDGGQNLSGICSTESIEIKNATLNITSNAKQGISCDKKVTVEGGAEINIESKGDGIHCNKFEAAALESGESESTINITSLSSSDGADGIDANDYIIINSGKINVVSKTLQKYALKVRKVIKGKENGAFEINAGTVTAVGNLNAALTSCSQKTLYAKSRTATVFTVGDISSQEGTAFICSPVSADTVTNSKGSSKTISWTNNIGTVSF